MLTASLSLTGEFILSNVSLFFVICLLIGGGMYFREPFQFRKTAFSCLVGRKFEICYVEDMEKLTICSHNPDVF